MGVYVINFITTFDSQKVVGLYRSVSVAELWMDEKKLIWINLNKDKNNCVWYTDTISLF